MRLIAEFTFIVYLIKHQFVILFLDFAWNEEFVNYSERYALLFFFVWFFVFGSDCSKSIPINTVMKGYLEEIVYGWYKCLVHFQNFSIFLRTIKPIIEDYKNYKKLQSRSRIEPLAI